MNRSLTPLLTAAAAAAVALCLLILGPQTARGAREGLSLCAQALIPSLFPFMALSLFVGRSPAAPLLARLADPLCRRWLRLPPCLGPAVLMSLLGGYPVGARMAGELLKRGEISAAQARRCLQFAVFPAPSFAVVTVGSGVLGSPGAGAVLYGCHLFWALVLGRCRALRHPLPPPCPARRDAVGGVGAALVEGTAAAVEGMLSVCGFAVVFSALGAVPQALGLSELASTLLWGLLEVSGGVFACLTLGWRQICFLVPLLVSFGSLSVLCQLGACLGQGALSPLAAVPGRLLHGLLCAATAGPLLLRLAPARAAWQTAVQPLAEPAAALSAAALLGLGSLLLFSLCPPPNKTDKF